MNYNNKWSGMMKPAQQNKNYVNPILDSFLYNQINRGAA